MHTLTRISIVTLISVIIIGLLGAILISPTNALAVEGVVELENPLNLDEDQPIADLAGRVIRAFLGIIGIIGLVIFIYGGVLWMTSAGHAERVTRGKDLFVWSIVGLVVIFSSYTIVSFVLTKVISNE